MHNQALTKLLEEKGQNTDEIWTSITVNEGSVQHLDFLSQEEKDVFKTAFELDQRWVVELAADRAPHISQAQSVNIFLPADVHKRDLHQIHYQAWKKGLKSLYYCRSKSIARAEVIATGTTKKKADMMEVQLPLVAANTTDYEECLACQ